VKPAQCCIKLVFSFDLYYDARKHKIKIYLSYIKGKVIPFIATKTSAVDRGEWSTSSLGQFSPGKESCYSLSGDHRAGLDVQEKTTVSCGYCVSVTYKSTPMTGWDDTTRVHNGHHLEWLRNISPGMTGMPEQLHQTSTHLILVQSATLTWMARSLNYPQKC